MTMEQQLASYFLICSCGRWHIIPGYQAVWTLCLWDCLIAWHWGYFGSGMYRLFCFQMVNISHSVAKSIQILCWWELCHRVPGDELNLGYYSALKYPGINHCWHFEISWLFELLWNLTCLTNMQCPNLGSAEHGVPKTSPIAKTNKQAETGGERCGGTLCPVSDFYWCSRRVIFCWKHFSKGNNEPLSIEVWLMRASQPVRYSSTKAKKCSQ